MSQLETLLGGNERSQIVFRKVICELSLAPLLFQTPSLNATGLQRRWALPGLFAPGNANMALRLSSWSWDRSDQKCYRQVFGPIMRLPMSAMVVNVLREGIEHRSCMLYYFPKVSVCIERTVYCLYQCCITTHYALSDFS